MKNLEKKSPTQPRYQVNRFVVSMKKKKSLCKTTNVYITLFSVKLNLFEMRMDMTSKMECTAQIKNNLFIKYINKLFEILFH